jgi:ribose 5-phosphate isomerase B
MKIYLASDHAGFELKESLRKWLVKKGYEVKDFGAYSYSPTDDYPDFVKPLAAELSQNPDYIKGIILGGSGQGEAMMANRFKGVRAAVLYNFSADMVRLTRQHNDANVLSLGARFLSEKKAKKAVEIFLETKFDTQGENARHLRRIKKID